MPAWTNIFGQLHHHHDKGQEFVQAGIKTHFLFSFMSVSVIILNGVITIVAELPTLSSLSRVTVSVIFSFNVPSTTRYHTIVERGVLRTSYAKLRGWLNKRWYPLFLTGRLRHRVCPLRGRGGRWGCLECSVLKQLETFRQCNLSFSECSCLCWWSSCQRAAPSHLPWFRLWICFWFWCGLKCVAGVDWFLTGVEIYSKGACCIIPKTSSERKNFQSPILGNVNGHPCFTRIGFTLHADWPKLCTVCHSEYDMSLLLKEEYALQPVMFRHVDKSSWFTKLSSFDLFKIIYLYNLLKFHSFSYNYISF